MLLSSANIPTPSEIQRRAVAAQIGSQLSKCVLPCEPGARLSTVHDFMHQ